ncbi:MAG: hypothetical protein WA006_04455 [Rhodoglobus sp.]
MDRYLSDLDKTLYAYDFRRRLPAPARLAGVSQYRLARRWWADGTPVADGLIGTIERFAGRPR